jgi:hypothetical protein
MLQKVLMTWLIVLGLTGCGDIPPANDPASANSPSAAELAQQIVAERIAIDPSLVTISESTAVDFPDASLDCPQPGMAYAQVITPGYRVTAEAQGEFFDIRVSGSRAIICENSPNRQAPRRTY